MDANPFEAKVPSVIERTDAPKLDAAYQKAIALSAAADINVVEKLGTISSTHLKQHLQLLRHGKQNNIVKVQMIADTLPDLLAIKEAANKFQDTLEVQSKKMAGSFWKHFAQQSDGGKISMDVVKVVIKNILQARGEAVPMDE